MSWIASQTYVLQHILLSITIIIIARKQELDAGGGDPVAAAAAGAQGQRDPQAGEGATQTQGRSQLKILKDNKKIFKDNKKIFKDFVLRLHFHSITNKSCHEPLEELVVSGSQGSENIWECCWIMLDS